MPYSLDRLTIKGFKSIRELKDFELSDLNILIGANGAGKSNLIEFFRLLRNIVDSFPTVPSVSFAWRRRCCNRIHRPRSSSTSRNWGCIWGDENWTISSSKFHPVFIPWVGAIRAESARHTKPGSSGPGFRRASTPHPSPEGAVHMIELNDGTLCRALIDHFQLENVIVANHKDGASIFERLREKDFHAWLETYSVGELWSENVISGGPNLE